MDFSGVKEMLEAINASEISYFEYETNDGHIVMDKSLVRNINANCKQDTDNSMSEAKKANSAIQEVSSVVENNNESPKELEGYVVKSPIVGTFYKAPGEGKEPFVKVGDLVNKGDTICIVEAMKLMNEIEAEVSGVVEEILAIDGQMVEYGQPLFRIKEN